MKKPTQSADTKFIKSTIRIKKPPYQGWSHKTVEHVLQNDGLLQALKQHSLYLRQLQGVENDVLRDLTNMQLPVEVSRYESGLLKLYVPNAAMATRLRFLQNQLLTVLTAQSAFVHLIKIVVRVDQTIVAVPSPRYAINRSTNFDHHLVTEADPNGEDQRLLASLQRLARHAPI